jgi:hypothetical protein
VDQRANRGRDASRTIRQSVRAQDDLVDAIEKALAEHQPFLATKERAPDIVIEGMLVLSGPDGPLRLF